MLMNENRRDYKGRREKMCVFTQGSSLGKTPRRLSWRGGVFCAGLHHPAIAGVCEECCERGGCAHLHARSCLSSCILAIPAASVCRLSAGVPGVNAGRICLSVGRGRWMAAFHGQQKHWLRVRADLRLLRKPGLEFWVDRDLVKNCGVYKRGWALQLRQTVLKYMLV